MDNMDLQKNINISQVWEDYFSTGSTQSKNELVMYYLPIVKRIVRRMMPAYYQYCEFDDLVGYGVLGLIDAIDKFDLKFNVKFESYAVSRVRGEILDNIRKQDWAPSSMRAKIKSINRAIEEMELQNEGRVDDEAIAQKLGMDVKQLRQIQEKSYIFNVVSFESMMSNMSIDYGSASDMVCDDPENRPDARLDRKEFIKMLSQAIAKLPESERMVIDLYYNEELMLKDIAQLRGVSESRISQIHSKALSRLCDYLGTMGE